jgi:hypothetical protein
LDVGRKSFFWQCASVIESGYVFETSFSGIEIVNTAVTIRIRTLRSSSGKNSSVLRWLRSKNGKKSLPNVCVPNKTRGQSHQQTGKSVDAVVAVPLQRRSTLKLHPHHNHS